MLIRGPIGRCVFGPVRFRPGAFRHRAERAELADGAAGPPVEAGGATGQERLVDQVPAQRAVVVEDRLQDPVDLGFRVPAAGLEGLRHLVKKQQTAGALGGKRGDLAVTDKGPKLLRRIGEKTAGPGYHLI